MTNAILGVARRIKTEFEKRPRLRGAGLVLFALIAAHLAWLGMFLAWPHYQSYDGVYFTRSIDAVRASLLRYHEWPLWNPYECGGVPLWDNPQSLTASPLLVPLLGLRGENPLRAWHVLHSALGFLSMWLLARKGMALGRLGSFVASLTWAFGGFHWQHASIGHASFASFQYLPLATYLARKSEESRWATVLFGALLANVLFEGGTYPAPLMGVVLAVDVLARCTSFPRIVRVTKSGLLALAFGIGFSAPKLLPLLDQFSARPRQIPREPDEISLRTIFEMLTARTHSHLTDEHRWEWHEYGSYIGMFSLGIAVVGFVVAFRRAKWLYLPLVIGLLLVSGDFASWAPWTFLNTTIFPFRDMRVPARWIVLVLFALSGLAGVGFDVVARVIVAWANRRSLLARVLVTAFLTLSMIVVSYDLLGAPMPAMAERFREPPPPRAPIASRLFLGGPSLPPPLGIIAANRSAIDCHEDWGTLLGAPLWEGDVPQAKAAKRGAEVKNVLRTQNRFVVDLEARSPTRILLNTNFDRNWRANAGTIVDDEMGLAVDVGAGSTHLEVWYRPRRLNQGIALFLCTLALGVLFVRKKRNAPST